MDKRKKLIRLFTDIRAFCRENAIAASPYTFLLNRFYFTVSGKRLAPSALRGIAADDFLKVNAQFADRLKRSFVSSWSISYLLSLPHPAPIEAAPHISAARHDILFLSDAVYLPYHLEKGHALHFAHLDEAQFTSPFSELHAYPLSKDKPVEISVQATIFDLFSHDTERIRPYRFHLIIDEAIVSALPQEGFFRNIALLLHDEGAYLLHLKKNFLLSPATKKEKRFLYKLFALHEITKETRKIILHFRKRRPTETERAITITDAVKGSLLSIPNDFISFNNLLTFNDNLAYDQIEILKKIEAATDAVCGDHFDFFLGMFPAQATRPPIDPMRRSGRYKPFIRGKEIAPFAEPTPSAWILPDKEFFFQLPASTQFERHKLLARYFSVRPVMCRDLSGLHFLNDIAGIIPRNAEVSLDFAEGFFNSSLILFYYTLKFPHHNKFLKKNFNSVPFIAARKHIQGYITESVQKLREMQALPEPRSKETLALIEQRRRAVDRDIYQLFRLSPDEIRIIERSIEPYRG